jgi:GTP-binding protein
LINQNNLEDNKSEYKRPVAEFICSAAYYKEIPPTTFDEYGILGRSNVGKSSFINHVLENHSLARISKRPGKTSLANLYKVNGGLIWVDFPGYGYAQAPGQEKLRWSRLIADYFKNRIQLRGILWLVDIRHIGLKADMEAYEWIKSLKKPVLPILTKADKLSMGLRRRALDDFKNSFPFKHQPVIYSIQEHKSREAFWKSFEEWRLEIQA